MLRSNLKLIFRQLRNIYSYLNLLGLTVGFTVFILIFLWANEELSYDRFHIEHENIYRILSDQGEGTEKPQLDANTCAPLAEYLKTNYAEIRESCRLENVEFFIKHGETGFYNHGFAVDTSFFKIFSYPIKSGNLKNFFKGTDKIIISKALAKKYFNDSDPIGKAVLIANRDVEVVAVMENIPPNSHLQFDFLMPIKFVEVIGMVGLSDWDFYFLNTYIKTTKTDALALGKKIKDAIRKNEPESTTGIYLQPLTDIHLKSGDITSDSSGRGSITYVYLFFSISIFILVIAGINYSNLATAQSIKRSKETGVRKVLGSSRIELASFFFLESVLYALFALMMALLLSWLLLPYFNSLSGKQLSFEIFSVNIFGSILCFALITALLGGAYPALVLSAHKPVVVLKGLATSSITSIRLRRGLVILQFVLSISLLSGAFIVQKQLNYIQSKNLGYDKEGIISFSLIRKVRANYPTIKNELLALKSVKSVAANNQKLSLTDAWTQDLEWEGKNPDYKPTFFALVTDFDFLKTFSISIIAGRDFSKEIASDSSALVVNEAAVALMGLTDPINKPVKLHDKDYTIVGIAKNFHFKSIHTKIEPLIIYTEPRAFFTISIKLNPGDRPQQLKEVEAVFKKFTPDRPFDYTFLEDDIQKNYADENRTGKIFIYFSGLAIFISCLGLFGIILFVTEQRAKEMAIRKTLGAPIYKLMLLLSSEYILMAVIGFFIATPIMYWGMGKWLANFAYRIEISWWLFILAALVTLVFTCLTIFYRTYQSATNSPVESLKSE